jgi:hypothetical protein
MNALTDLEIMANEEARHAHRELVEQADAREAAAYEAAANEVDCGGCHGTCANPSNCHSKDATIIRALTPADAKAALDRLIREAEERGAQKERERIILATSLPEPLREKALAEAVQADRERQRKWETGDE